MLQQRNKHWRVYTDMNQAARKEFAMKKLLARFLKKYVRVFPRYDRAVICRFAGGCARGCPCSEREKKAYVFKFICNYRNNITGDYMEVEND